MADSYREAIDHWLGAHGELSNLAALHEWLVAEKDYSGSERSISAVSSARCTTVFISLRCSPVN